ncbi:hypothetical protein FOMPIDRAFT_1020879, partial [Fomitopsis schrenkii]
MRVPSNARDELRALHYASGVGRASKGGSDDANTSETRWKTRGSCQYITFPMCSKQTWSDKQMKVMIIYLADFRDAPDDDRRVDIINRALEEMDTIGAPAPFPAQATRVTAVRKWLNKHVDMLDETPREAKGSTRGCDLWARKHARLVHDHAYLQGNYNGLDPLKAYNKARWELWQGLADEEKKEWNRKGETARALVTKDLSKVEPPLHTAAAVCKMLRNKFDAWQKKIYVETGAVVINISMVRTIDEGLVFTFDDATKQFGAQCNFKELLQKQGWKATELWARIIQHFNSMGNPAEEEPKILPSGKTSTAKPTTGFGSLYELGDDGLPIIPPEEQLNARVAATAKYWSAMVRQFLNAHQAAASNNRSHSIPWTTAKEMGSMDVWFPAQMWPAHIPIKDPSKISKEDCIALVYLWRQAQELVGFRFRNWIDKAGNIEETNYEGFVNCWMQDAPHREKRKAAAGARQADQMNATRVQGTAVPPPYFSPQERVSATMEAPGKQEDEVGAKGKAKGGTGEKAKSKGGGKKGKARDHRPDASGIGREKAIAPPPQSAASGSGRSQAHEDSALASSGNPLEVEAEHVGRVSALAPPSPMTGPDLARSPLPVERPLPKRVLARNWKDLAPADLQVPERYGFLKSLSSEPNFQALLTACIRAKAVSESNAKPRPASPEIQGACWSTWKWDKVYLPDSAHSSESGLEPLFAYLRKGRPKWEQDALELAKAEQVLLTVGMALRDLYAVQFAHDPEDLPQGVPAYITDSKLSFAQVAQLESALEPM